MEIDVDEHVGSLYRTLSGAVVPRPIGWISTRSATGVDNLAPYSFFNVVSIDPPVVMFAPVDADDGLKDTPQNVLDTEVFAVNIVTADLVEAMNETATGHDVDEFERAGLTKREGTRIDAPYVGESKVVFECELYEFVDIGVSSLVLGEVTYVHVDDAVVTAGKLDTTKLDAVGRLAGSEYTYTRDRFSLERPE
ncbi:flavin reductase family protein [Halorarius litoreus]|uniref:flavin reductase family protein n=1 Tax=Halorarius litoreus TaxID=2962676 RepID=UPI0020CF167F|nr:flavin reductase family protein [Halorarius litoreus]